MTAICDAAIHLCRVRATRLDQLGRPTSGPNNVYITDKPMMLAVKPQIEAGQDKTLVGGCDCIIAQYRGYDKLKYFDLEMDLGVIEPGLLEMLTGGAVILNNVGEPIGISFPSQLDCAATPQPNVAIEACQHLWASDHQDASYPYVRWVFPSTRWQLGDNTLQNDFLQPKLNGFTRSNPNWGLGIFHDLTQAIGSQGGFVYDTVIPAARCGYQSFTLT